MTYTPVIGLEVHIQAKTRSKMFCSCSSEYFGDEPNTHVCPVCLGLPGALPVPNKRGLEQCIKVALALDSKITRETKFDRKNYFYPDLPKGYQISQYDKPVGVGGYLEIEVEGDSRRIRMRRVHMEEDTGKSIHESGATYLDFNKSGVPLIEAVTEPDFTDVKEVASFAKLLRQTVIYIGASDCEMQKGQMRFELNISLRKEGEQGLPNYKVEVKNIGSISVLEKVIDFEIERQKKLLDLGEMPVNETRGIRDQSGETFSQRTKETEADYRYFPEPDIPPIEISDEWIEALRKEIPELPAKRKARYISELGLEAEQADILVEQREKGDYIDKLLDKGLSKDELKEVVKWFIGDISGMLDKDGRSVSELRTSPEDLIYLVKELRENRISGAIVKKVLEIQDREGGRAEEIVNAGSLTQISDSSEIERLVDQTINDNPKVVESLAKNPNAIKALVGYVMKLSKGKANPKMSEELIKKKLGL